MLKSLSKKTRLIAQVLLILLIAGGLSVVDFKLPLKLGLDLAGGTQLDYKIDLSRVAEADQSQIIEGVKEVIRRRVDSLGVAEPNIYTSNIADEYHVVVELAGISNIDEAKKSVGKTIQLEFKEENTEPNAGKVEQAKARSQSAYEALLSGEDFAKLSEAEKVKYPEMASATAAVTQEIGEMSEGLKVALEGKQAGSILAPFDLDDGYTYDANTGKVIQQKGIAVIQVIERKSEPKEIKTEESVSAKHILVSYEGAERSEASRTKEEAKKSAEEVLAKLNAGENFDELAKQFSDDASNKDKGGDLGAFKKGVMDPAFEEAAFALEKDKTSGVVESAFGFHIIRVYDKLAAETKTETVEKVTFNKLLYSTLPDPWKSTPAMTGEHFKHADVILNEAYQPYVSITFTSEGAKLFETLTGNNIEKQIAIFVGGELVSAPSVHEAIAGGQAQITGNFTLQEAQDLARDLNTGAIPAPIDLSGQTTISATLGAEALTQSLKAGALGIGVLTLFMVLYYRLPGLLAIAALAVYSVLMVLLIKLALPAWAAILISLAVFAYIVHLILKSRDSGGEKFVSFLLACTILFFLTFVLSSTITLTLAGVAGLILSIGMAVDANILIFERIKEELAEKNLKDAIQAGFLRAWDSIRDSNFSSLITCAILFYFGSSIIRGFALNLALGILVSMFSAITLTKTFLHASSETGWAKKLWLYGKAKGKKTHFQFMKWRKSWLGFSGVLIAISLISLALFGLKLGLDFTGGTVMEVKLAKEGTTQEQVKEKLDSVQSAQVNTTKEGNFLVRLPHLTEAEHDQVILSLNQNFEKAEEIRFTTVGPSIGKTLQQKAFLALALALVMIIFYIAFAFRKIPKELSPWRFGWTAIAALVHDVIITIGAFSLLGHFAGVEVDALFITAILTVMGFSVHDTIVVFDRIRENLTFRKAGEMLSETADKAMNQTLARSINTSLVTLITILALVFFGPKSTQMFTVALALGITVGTYSSIFVASPLMVLWNEKFPQGKKK